MSCWGLIVISLVFEARLKLVKLKCISNFNQNEYMTGRSPLRRYKGAQKEFRGLKVALINIVFLVSITFWYLRGNSIDDGHSVSIARGTRSSSRIHPLT